MKSKILITIIILGLITVFVVNRPESNALKVGIISPLTGNSAYWGESTLIGMRLAEAELKMEGINIDFIIEDGKLDPATALSAAQKLVNVDGVTAIFSEFNPASISVASFLKGKNVFHLYNAASISPLDSGTNNFKTYLDYEMSCKETAQYIKDHKNVKRVGVLKMNLEPLELCLKGIQSVFGSDAVVESYDPSATDFRVELTKLDKAKVDAIFHASFQQQTLISLKEMQRLNMKELFVGLTETITPGIILEYKTLIEGDIFFGLPPVSEELAALIKSASSNKDVGSYNAAGLAYVHLVQIGHALAKCGSTICIEKEMSESIPNPEIGFQGFNNRIAEFDVLISEWENGKFVSVK